MVLISVQGTGAVEFNEYSITAYYHMRRLIPNSPSFAVIDEGTMAYFMYKSYCEDCTIFLSAAPFAIDSDIDMYLNIGADKDLPTTDSYDIKRDEWFTEHIELDTQNEFFKKKNIDTMQNTILIGIYAKENSIIYIDAEESKSRMKTLSHGKGFHVEQPANDQKFFQYIHKGDSSIKFELTGLHGEVDMRVNCYNPHQLDRPMSAYLPQDQRTSKWDTNSKQSTSIVIENEEEEYCKNGVYLIAITSMEQGAKYTIEAQRGGTFTSKQIKIGVPIKDQISEEHEKQYMFVLDKKKPFKVTASIYAGKISFSIGEEKDFTRPLFESEDDHIEISKSDVQKFKTGQNIYIRVRGEFDHSEFILVATHDDSYSIIPDSFTQTFSIDPLDEDGLRLMYYPPNVDHELKIQVNSFTDAVYFHVERKKEYLYQIKSDKLAFPKPDMNKLAPWFTKNWDSHARHYSETVQMKSNRTDDYVILFLISPQILDKDLLRKEKKDKVKVTVNINSHQMIVLTANVAQEVSLSPQVGDYAYFKFFANGRKDIEINLIPCM